MTEYNLGNWFTIADQVALLFKYIKLLLFWQE